MIFLIVFGTFFAWMSTRTLVSTEKFFLSAEETGKK